MTIANRGARYWYNEDFLFSFSIVLYWDFQLTESNINYSHQNTIVHATTARLLYVIVSEIGAENAMNMPREVKDKLFATTAKLLTDGNLQAR